LGKSQSGTGRKPENSVWLGPSQTMCHPEIVVRGRSRLDSGLPAGGEQAKHGVVAFESCGDLVSFKAVRYRLSIERDLPFPLRGLVRHRDIEHAGTIFFHPPSQALKVH
jgi:hypothetical protein